MSSALSTKMGKIPASKGTPGIDSRTILVLGAALLAAGSGWHLWTVPRLTRTTEMIVAEYLFVAGLSLLVLALLNTFNASILISKLHGWSLDTPVAACLSVSIWFLGMRQFGGYDHSALIQAAWLQFSSLVPFKDYPCTLPPLFFLGARYAFLLFGVCWSAFVLLMGVFAVLSFLFLSRQFRALGFPVAGATILALAAELGTTVVCSYWWHNAITSVIGLMVFVSTLACLAHANDWKSWASLGVSFTLLILSKPNAWPVGACIVLLFTRDAGRRLRALTVLILGILLSGTICWLHGLSPLNVLRTYSEIAKSRGNPFSMVGLSDAVPVERRILLLSTAVIVFLFLGVLAANRNELLRQWREYSCCVITAFTSLAMASMNYEVKTSDLMPLVIVLAVAAFRPWSKRRLDGIGRVATLTVIVCFVILSSYWGVTRMRVRGIGEYTFFEDVPTQIIETGFFAGLHSGPRLIAVLWQVEYALDKYPSNKVFFGPRMEFSYAAFRRNPLRGLPIWWHSGTSFPDRDLDEITRTFESADFDLLIFLRGDFTRMSLPALQRKIINYERDPRFSQLDVFVRTNGGGMAPQISPRK